MSISAPKLLSIFENDEQKRDFGNSNFCWVTIVGDSLKEFDYNGNLINEYCLHMLSSMEKACIHTQCDGVSEENPLRMINLLKRLSNVEQITLVLGVYLSSLLIL